MLAVGRFFGVPIYFAPSWVIIAALLTVEYAPYIRHTVPSLSASSAYLLAFAFAVLFAACVLAHELGHTAASLALRLPVRRIVIFLLGGVSEIERDPERPRDEFLVAAAGPAVSVLLAAAGAGLHAAVQPASMPGVMFLLLFWSNLVVAIFNLLPGLPLDGGRLLRSGVWALGATRLTGTKAAVWAGRGVAIAVAFLGLVVDRSSGGFASGIIALAVAAYLWFGAGQALRVGEMLDRATRVDLDALLRPGLLIDGDVSVAEALRRAWAGNARGLVLVDGMQRPRAIVDEALIGAVPPDRRPWTTVAEVARPLEPGLVLPAGLSGSDLIAAMRRAPAHEYLVVNRDGSPAGILSASDLLASLRGAR
jgi:Zn-dependent protease